ncbi:MAG: hypothetical protein ACRYFS_26450 [Janthinobacterium lividum]
MTRSAVRVFHFILTTALLTGFCLSAVRADGPTLTAVFGVAGHYRPGGWCLVTVSVRNPGADPISGQLQVLTSADTSQQAYGRPARSDTSSIIYACPITVSGGISTPQTFPLYIRGIDPGQANLTVQLVEGRARGGGRVLAQINTQNSSTSADFTGGPVSGSDSLLVGFGGDPGAFTFLNGCHTGPALPNAPATLPNRGMSNGVMPSTLQVAELATASDLPDKAAGYAGVDSFLLRSDAPLDGLTEAQSNALKGWVISGGHLIVCGGTDPTRFQSAFFEGLLPATISTGSTSLTIPGAGSAGALLLVPKPLPGVQVLLAAASHAPLIVSGPYGAGIVTLAAYDPAAGAFRTTGQAGLPPTWSQLFSSRRDPTSSVLAQAAAREENPDSSYNVSLLSSAVMRGPSLDAPGTSIIGAFLLIYLIVLVPANYLVLKRLDRKEWAWMTIPALVFIFAAGTFAVGYAAKGGSVFVNRAALIETSAGRQEAGVYSELGLFSPHRTTYDITLAGANMNAAIPDPGPSYGRSDSDSQLSGPAQFVQTPAGISMPDTPVNMWAMRSFDMQSTTDLGGAIDGTLTEKNGQVTGNLVNHTPYAFTDCSVWFAGHRVSLGSLAAGGNSAVLLAVSGNVSLFGAPSLAYSHSSSTRDDIHDRMHTALADYFHSLNQGNPNNGGGASVPFYTPSRNEALLVGWSSDPKLSGPAPLIDGSSVTENDVSLVIVHIPVAAK